MNRKVFFVEPQPIKRESLLSFLLALFMFVITPAVSLFVITRGEQTALYNSMSRLAWAENLLAPIYICGALNLLTFIFAEYLALKKIGFAKLLKIVFVVLTTLIVLTNIVGLGIPCRFTDEPRDVFLRTIHIKVSTAGFISIYVIIILFTITVWFCDRKIALFGTLADIFTAICGTFALLQVNDPTSFVVVSAPAQICLFTLYSISMAMHYYGACMFRKK